MGQMLIIAGVVAAVVVVVALLLLVGYSKLYKRARADQAIVRTGKGGTVAIKGGGIWVIPIFHLAQMVSLKQILIPIDRKGIDALVASDRIEAEVDGQMYVKVGDTPEDIIQAAQSFGENVSPENINRMIQGKVTDAMRAEAFKMSFEDLNVRKEDFAEAIGKSVEQDLKKTGLVLDSVSVTSINQVLIDPDPNNMPHDTFKAEGVKNVVRSVEANREETNRIRREKEIQIQKVDVDAREQALALDMRRKKLEADQIREVEEYEAQKQTEAKKAVFLQVEEAESARINKEEVVRKREILMAEAVSVRESAKTQEEQVAAHKASQAILTADIAKQKAVTEADIAKQKAVQTADIAKMQAVETANIQKQEAIAVANEAKAAAQAKQAAAEALEEKEKQGIITVTETEQAGRAKQVAIIKAEETARQEVLEAEAERDSRSAKAEAEAKEAQQRAEAERNKARGEADAAKARAQGTADAKTTTAKGNADAIKLEAQGHADNMSIRAEADAAAAELQAAAQIKLAEAKLAEGKALAESEKLMVEAGNAISRDLLIRDVLVAAITKAPEAIDAFMKPAASISDVKVLQLSGMGEVGEGGVGTQQGLPGIITGALAQSAGLLPIIRELTGFMQDSGIIDAAKSKMAEVTQEVKSAVTDSTDTSKHRAVTPQAPRSPSV